MPPKLALLAIGLIVALAGAAIQAAGGATGYYSMDASGVLGERIGRMPPTSLISGREKLRVSNGVALQAR